MATLKDAKIGQTVRVKKLTGEGAVKRRIMDMGITKGVEVYIRKVAPLRLRTVPAESRCRTDRSGIKNLWICCFSRFTSSFYGRIIFLVTS